MIDHNAFFGDGPRSFRLTDSMVIELERLTETGIGSLFLRLTRNDFRLPDLIEVIRLGLIGGGTSPEEAARLVDTYALHEISVVAVPCHPGAQITSLKSDGSPKSTNQEYSVENEELAQKAEAKTPANDAPVIELKDFEAVKARLDKLEAKGVRGAPAITYGDDTEKKAFLRYLQTGTVEAKALISDRNTARKIVWRAGIVLATADGCGTNEIMRRSQTSKPTVWRWQERYLDEGVPGLQRDKTRPSRVPPLPRETRLKVIAKTVQEAPPNATHWSRSLMAEAVGISPSSVGRIWAEARLKPHLTRSFKVSNDPMFEEKVTEIVVRDVIGNWREADDWEEKGYTFSGAARRIRPALISRIGREAA